MGLCDIFNRSQYYVLRYVTPVLDGVKGEKGYPDKAELRCKRHLVCIIFNLSSGDILLDLQNAAKTLI